MARKILKLSWISLLGGTLFSIGLISSRVISQVLGLSLQRFPNQAPEAIAGYYLIIGSIVLTASLLPLALGLCGGAWSRTIVLSVLLILGFAFSSTIESMIYSSSQDLICMIPILVVPCVLLAGSLGVLTKGKKAMGLSQTKHLNFNNMDPGQLLNSLVGAILIFPTLYFIFGIMVSPLVTPYYEHNIAGLIIPEPKVIIMTELLRGLVHVIAIFPVIFAWGASKRMLVVSISLTFFVFVMAYDVVLACQIPPKLILIHGIEVLIKSFIYGWVLVTLLNPIVEKLKSDA